MVLKKSKDEESRLLYKDELNLVEIKGMEDDKSRLLILYASQTGNALDAAERVGREAERRGCSAVAVLSMDEFDASCLHNEDTVIFIVSTTGQGDIPDSMKVFWRFLLQRNLGKQWLEGVKCAVFGLGDSGYQKYNFAAKKLDKRLTDLGAKRIIEKGLGDDQHPSGYEGAFDPWLSSLWSVLNQINPTIFPRGTGVMDPDMRTLDRPKFQIIYHDIEKMQSLFSTTSDLKCAGMQIERARSMSPGKLFHDKNRHPCFLQMTENQQLTKVGSEKDVRHFEFEAISSTIDYQAGDVLEVLPGQDPVAVDAFIQRCNLNPDMFITVQRKGIENGVPDSPINSSSGPVKLRTFVELAMDVASASPRRYFFEARILYVMSFFASAEHEKERLQYFASPEGRDDLYQYNQKERRTVLEVLEDFPSVQMPFEWLVQLVPPLKTRAFSISSSPLAHPNQVHLTVSVVSWKTPFKRTRSGLCSTWLAGLDPEERVFIPVWFNQGSLPPPPPSLPLILIGPGTGCAPFRAFVAERAVQSASGPTAPILFFFGCRNEENDFLYKDFWLSHSKSGGVLSEEKGGGFFVAFSRDQPQKVYVQHKMMEESQRIWSLLSAGAAVYVSGSSTKMPADVFSCMEEIISRESGVPKESAVRWLHLQEKAGKYNVEAWS
ncbi:Flavodoxin [Macleaya cordata]|uniref:NADPH-dependent diflavin oxidoreductase 1 n=1 Tax=Macleaya cordata TaxID=56857 RepID=A0A200PTB4_MACCD|nr:Flavodoxin [Macleaya cordata]